MSKDAQLRAIAAAFNAFVRQLELGDHRDALDHQALMNRGLVELREAIAKATDAEVADIAEARTRATVIAEGRRARPTAP